MVLQASHAELLGLLFFKVNCEGWIMNPDSKILMASTVVITNTVSGALEHSQEWLMSSRWGLDSLFKSKLQPQGPKPSDSTLGHNGDADGACSSLRCEPKDPWVHGTKCWAWYVWRVLLVLADIIQYYYYFHYYQWCYKIHLSYEI